jgi:HlyD family type I secretion membrane fusion protein
VLIAERGEILARIAGVRQSIGEAELQITQARKTFLEQVETDLRTTQAKLFESSERLHATTAELSRMEVRSPEAGVVVDMAVHTVDGVISPGSRILDIVPQNDHLVVDAQIRPADIDGLEVGMQAEIRFPAFNQRTTPMIHGQLKTVSADRLVDPKTGQPYFNVRVLVDDKSKESISGLNIIPGMPAEVVIKKGERTLMSYLLQPMTDTIVRAMRE